MTTMLTLAMKMENNVNTPPNTTNGSKKSGKKRKQSTAARPTGIASQTRSQSRNATGAGSSTSSVTMLDSPIVMRGTLGEGDNAVQVHPSTPVPNKKRRVDPATPVPSADTASKSGVDVGVVAGSQPAADTSAPALAALVADGSNANLQEQLMLFKAFMAFQNSEAAAAILNGNAVPAAAAGSQSSSSVPVQKATKAPVENDTSVPSLPATPPKTPAKPSPLNVEDLFDVEAESELSDVSSNEAESDGEGEAVSSGNDSGGSDDAGNSGDENSSDSDSDQAGSETSPSDDGPPDPNSRPMYPPTCQVTDPDSVDPLIKHLFNDAVKLWRPIVYDGSMQTEEEGSRQPNVLYPPSNWIKVAGAGMKKAIVSLFEMSREDNMVNLARCDPAILKGYASGDRQYLRIGDDSAICLTPVCVGVTYLGNTLNRFFQRGIHGIPHAGEWERMTAVVATVFKKRSVKVNIWDSTAAFLTFAAPKNKAYNNFEGVATSAVVKASPGKPRNKFPGRIAPTLSADEEVPVFDARGKDKFRLTKLVRALSKKKNTLSITEKMAEAGLSRYRGNIKGGSCVLVAHTVTGLPPTDISDKDGIVLTFNIQWAILLADGDGGVVE